MLYRSCRLSQQNGLCVDTITKEEGTKDSVNFTLINRKTQKENKNQSAYITVNYPHMS